ncbi:MAG: 6-pyruvoyl-tetrahydropterin synthase-related protein, partial [Chitinophagaceae bacterium]
MNTNTVNTNQHINSNGKKLLLIALSLVFITHGIIIYFTMPKTYDAFVHIFFADHYNRFWFEPWEYRWYTGFVTTSYPPLVHQMIALISKVFPLKIAFCIYAIFIYNVLVVGVYRFSKLFFNKTVAGVAAIVAVLLSSLIETLHIYGQMPTLTGISFLLNALPFLYQYVLSKKPFYLIMALSFLSVVICSHHVTAIFGMVFFIAPTIFMAIVDSLPKDAHDKNIFQFSWSIIKQLFSKYKQLVLFIVFVMFLAVVLIFPYWHWSKSDPINQVSIPHGSRDNFLKNTSSGLIFFVIPLVLVFALFPAISYVITKFKRFWGWAVAFFICILFGSGGTTPLPKIMLGANAFNILTLDRFGFWASIISIPFIAYFIHSFINGAVKSYWTKKIKETGHFTLATISAFSYLLFILFIFHLASFRPLQPKEIDIQPIVNFLNRDEHLRWRYLTLGFGDQMAWLSANTLAASVDGNYHSARRLPELTTRPIERLENAKFSGKDGLASLNDFLTKAEKYNLRYVFSNDRYYDPLLFYNGWNRTIRLENGIMIWERNNISTIKPITPKYLNPKLKILWGVLPVLSLVIALLLTLFYLARLKKYDTDEFDETNEIQYPTKILVISSVLPVVFFSSFLMYRLYELLLVREQKNPSTTVINFYNHLDFQEFEKAHSFFKKSPTYPLDQYLLEKSVSDGGLLPSYAKLDSIKTIPLTQNDSFATQQVFTRWRTALGYRNILDTFSLEKEHNKWVIIPKNFTSEIPQEQVRDYTFNIFKKQGKRFISSFPTIKDDRIKKPFAAYKQVNFWNHENKFYI